MSHTIAWEQLGEYLTPQRAARPAGCALSRVPVQPLRLRRVVRGFQPKPVPARLPLTPMTPMLLSDFSSDLRVALAKTSASKAVKSATKQPAVVVDPQQAYVKELRSKYPSYVFKGTEFYYAANVENQLTNAFRNTASSARSALAATSLKVFDVQAPQSLTDVIAGTRVIISLAATEDHTDVLHVRSIIEGALYKGGLKNFSNVEFRVTAEPAMVANSGSTLATQPGANISPLVPTHSGTSNNPGSPSALDNLFLGLGVSAPIAAVLAAAGLFILVKIAK